MKRVSIFLIILILMLTGCRPYQTPEDSLHSNPFAGISSSREIFAMDTYMTISCYGEQCEEALDAAEAEILRLDALLSVGNDDSEVCMLNRTGNGTLSDDTAVLMTESLDVFEKTEGAFDVTVGPLMELWGFTSGTPTVPEKAELNKVLNASGSEKLTYDPATKLLTLGQGQGIDFGGIAKGYCTDRLTEIFRQYDLDCALVSLGGNIGCYKEKPDGSLWRCGIRNPFKSDDPSALIGVVEVQDCAVVTSGAYERFFITNDGFVYHHILDPHTGYPANSGLVSVTVISKSGILSDALSTACYVMGEERSARFWHEYGDDFDLILVRDTGDVCITAPLKDYFTSDAPIYIIE